MTDPTFVCLILQYVLQSESILLRLSYSVAVVEAVGERGPRDTYSTR